MSKFNTTNTNSNTRITENKCGFKAYTMQDKTKLVSMVLTTFFNEAKYYGDNSNELVALATEMAHLEPKFVASLAIYARKEFHLRSVAHVLSAIIANVVESKKYAKQVIFEVCERPDDMTEILSCYLSMFGKPLPNSLKKGLANAMGKFNEFSYSKYVGANNDQGKAIKYRDMINLFHPIPKDKEQELLYKKILDCKLESIETWETEVSVNGNTKEVWEKLIADKKLGYMATLRNLVNMIKAQPNNIDSVYAFISNREQVLKSKQLPFRFMSAYEQVEKMETFTKKAMEAIEKAIEISTENLPKLKGKTVIAIDQSGSMGSYTISAKSTIHCNEIASLIGAIGSRICDECIIYTFDTSAYLKKPTANMGIIETAKAMRFNGGGTSIASPINEMIRNNLFADRLIILSDNESNSAFSGSYCTAEQVLNEYKNKINPNIITHAIDLQGYGTQQVLEGKKTNLIAGWSEKVFDFIGMFEDGYDTQVKKIESFYNFD